MTRVQRGFLFGLVLTAFVSRNAAAGPILLTGHDPDFHAQGQASGVDQLRIGLDYVMSGTLAAHTGRILWVESFVSPLGGHVSGFNSLSTVGLTAADYDVVDAVGFAAANLSNYRAIAIASTFGGMLTSAELNALGARSGDIAAFINAGGGLWASSESESGTTSLAHIPFFSFLPVTVLSVGTSGSYGVTAFGATLGFTNADVNDCCTHNSFNVPSGLNVVDVDTGFGGIPTTLAGNVRIQDGVIVPTGPSAVPEPATMSLVGLGLLAAGRRVWRRR